MQVTLMHNPGAGSGKPSAQELLDALIELGYTPFYQSTKADDFELALEKSKDLIVVAGGDGTIGKVAKRMVGKKIPLTFLPIGTANNLAKTFNLKELPRELIKKLPTFKKINFNVGIVCGPWGKSRFVESVGLGLFPEMMNNFKKIKQNFATKEEEVQQGLEFLLKLVPDLSAKPCTIVVDGEKFHGNFLLVEIMNIKTIGPNLPLAAQANPGDNAFEVVLVSEDEREAFLEYLKSYIENKTPAGDLTIRRGRSIQITYKEEIHIDDKIWPDNEKPENGVNSGHTNNTIKQDYTIDINMEDEKLELLVPQELEL